MAKDPKYIANHLRQVLINGASAPHAAEVQQFFKEEIKSRGWYTHEVRKLAVRFRRVILNDAGMDYLVAVADELFRGDVQEEKNLAVFLLETSTDQFGAREFRRFEQWLDRLTNWSDHDALVYYLLSPLMVSDPSRVKNVFRWAKSKNRWHRRAACVALIRGARQKMFFEDIVRLSNMLLRDEDDMVQKGLGWLLRETAKFDAKRTIPYLMDIRDRAPRLVLRTACETLKPADRTRVLAVTKVPEKARRL